MGLLKQRIDYVQTIKSIPVGQEVDFELKGRMYLGFMNAISRLQKLRTGKWTTRTHESLITIKRIS
jgi:hypothetical protein